MKQAVDLHRAKVIDPLNDPRWSSFVHHHPSGMVYQDPSWMKVISLTYKQVRPICFVLEDEGGAIRAALPCFIVRSKLTGTRIVSLAFSSYSDPLIELREDFLRLLEEIIQQLENIQGSYFELRCLRNLPLIADSKLRRHDYHKIHILNIEEKFEKISRLFHKDCIVRSVKKALKCGVTVRQGCSEDDLEKFYFIHALTRKRQGFPIQPYEFFKNMWEAMFPLGYLNLLLAELNKKPVAGIIVFKFKHTVSFEHGASLPKFLASRPNHLLLWKALEMACSEGYRYFDFGKTPPENEGLLHFKSRWGAQMYDLPYFYYPQIKGMMSFKQSHFKHKLLSTASKYLPLSLAKIMGRIAYHHLG